MSASRRRAAADLLQPRSRAACDVSAEPRACTRRAQAHGLARVRPASRQLAVWALALATALLPIGASAQLPGRAGSILVSAGVLRAGQADEAISPLHFVGSGVEATVGMHRVHGPVDLVASLQAGSATLAPSDGAGSSERLHRGAIRLAALRALVGGEEAGLAAGLELRTFFTVTVHSVQPHPIPAAFLLGGVSLGPAVRQRLAAPGGTLELDVAASLLSAMDHPYGSLGSGRSVLALTPATIASSRLAWGGISYSSGAGRRVGLEAAYRLELIDYADVQHVRHVTSGLTVGLRVRPRAMTRT